MTVRALPVTVVGEGKTGRCPSFIESEQSNKLCRRKCGETYLETTCTEHPHAPNPRACRKHAHPQKPRPASTKVQKDNGPSQRFDSINSPGTPVARPPPSRCNRHRTPPPPPLVSIASQSWENPPLRSKRTIDPLLGSGCGPCGRSGGSGLKVNDYRVFCMKGACATIAPSG